MKRFREPEDVGSKDPDPQPQFSPTQRTPVQWPADIDQYESPYTYENDLPDDADVKEQEVPEC